MDSATMGRDVESIAREARASGRALRVATTRIKNDALMRLASSIRGRAAEIERANREDLDAATHLSAAMRDRLTLTVPRIEGMARAVEEIVRLPDPVGRTDRGFVGENGLRVTRKLAPLGLVAMVYESRPNVTIEAAALAIKSGNACVLRGGREALRSNTLLLELVHGALVGAGLPSVVRGITPGDREEIARLARLEGIVDVLIPRGGEALVRYVLENARVPVLQHGKGVCHVYVHADADLAMAESIVSNAKTSRPGVCNALETLLVDAAVAPRFLPSMVASLRAAGVVLRGCERTRAIVDMEPATEADWDTEYLALELAVRVVDGLEAAIDHIERHGSRHTEAIVTRTIAVADRFVAAVDASVVAVNASTRWNDGGSLGLGAEMGISTSKLHAYGPMGLEELCTKRWVVEGDGHVRT